MKNILRLRLNRHLLSLAMGIGMLGVLIVGNVGTAMASNTPGVGNFDVTAGPLSATASTPTITFNNNPIDSTHHLTLDGTQKTINIVLPVTVTDARGTGNGWTVSFSADRFSSSAGNLVNDPTISSVATVQPVDNTSGSIPSSIVQVSGSTTSVPEGTTGNAAIPLLSVPNTGHDGMGSYATTVTMQLQIAARDYTGTYSSDFYVDSATYV